MEQPKIYFIFPYRNRQSHLEKMIPSLTSYMENKGLNYEIVIAEQDNNKSFRKGWLFNVAAGYLKTIMDDFYVILHDIDMIPTNIDYTPIRKNTDEVMPFCKNSYTSDKMTAIHMASQVSEHNYDCLTIYPGYTYYFGGVLSIHVDGYIKANGYSNNYPGWGELAARAEDDDFYFRCLKSDIHCYRRKPGVFESLPHSKHWGDPELMKKNHEKYMSELQGSQYLSDGYNTTTGTVKIKQQEKYIHLLIDEG